MGVSAADLAAVLRDSSQLERLIAREDARAVMARADEAGVAELFAHARPDLPPFDRRRREAALLASARDAQEHRLFGHLRDRGIAAAVMKGAAIARTHYPAPWCRPRLDLDLLIHAADRARVFAALSDLGYARAGRLPGDIVNHQEVFERELTPGIVHAVDVHWEATNRALFVRRLPARDLLRRSIPARWADDAVRELDAPDALILACVHRVAHHAGETRLIWWYDVWLLARALDASHVAAVLDRAERGGVAALCAHDLSAARDLFGPGGGALSPEVIARLEAAGQRERARRYLTAGHSPLGVVAADFAALDTWRDRGRLIREHLFPPPAFIAATYGTKRRAVLPFLYGWRIVSGAVRWIRAGLFG